MNIASSAVSFFQINNRFDSIRVKVLKTFTTPENNHVSHMMVWDESYLTVIAMCLNEGFNRNNEILVSGVPESVTELRAEAYDRYKVPSNEICNYVELLPTKTVYSKYNGSFCSKEDISIDCSGLRIQPWKHPDGRIFTCMSILPMREVKDECVVIGIYDDAPKNDNPHEIR